MRHGVGGDVNRLHHDVENIGLFVRFSPFLTGLADAVHHGRINVHGDDQIGAHLPDDIHRHRRGQATIDEVSLVMLDDGKNAGDGDGGAQGLRHRPGVDDHLFAGIDIRSHAGKRNLEVGEMNIPAEKVGQQFGYSPTPKKAGLGERQVD